MRSYSYSVGFPVTLALLRYLPATSATTDNTTCVDPTMNWYTQNVGETPCACASLLYYLAKLTKLWYAGQSYQRLRQTCTPSCEYFYNWINRKPSWLLIKIVILLDIVPIFNGSAEPPTPPDYCDDTYSTTSQAFNVQRK